MTHFLSLLWVQFPGSERYFTFKCSFNKFFKLVLLFLLLLFMVSAGSLIRSVVVTKGSKQFFNTLIQRQTIALLAKSLLVMSVIHIALHYDIM